MQSVPKIESVSNSHSVKNDKNVFRTYMERPNGKTTGMLLIEFLNHMRDGLHACFNFVFEKRLGSCFNLVFEKKATICDTVWNSSILLVM